MIIEHLRQEFESTFDLLSELNTEEKCVDYLAQFRWNGKPICQYCNHDVCYELNLTNRGKRWKCKKCRKQFSIRIGTPFQESKLPIRKLFVALYLSPEGISTHQLGRVLSISQKSAWYLDKKIKNNFIANEMTENSIYQFYDDKCDDATKRFSEAIDVVVETYEKIARYYNILYAMEE